MQRYSARPGGHLLVAAGLVAPPGCGKT